MTRNPISAPEPIIWYVIAMWIIALLSLGLIAVLWKARKRNGGTVLLLLLASISIWNAFSGIEFLSATLEAKVFWMRLAYIGISFSPSLMFFAVRSFYANEHPLHPVIRAVLVIIPLMTLLLVFTNQYHGLIWRSMAIDPSNQAGLWEYGLWFQIWAGLSYITLASTCFVILRAVKQLSGFARMQALLVFVSMLPPWLMNGLYLSGFDQGLLKGYDFTPMSFGFTVILLAINHWVFNFLNRTSIARQRVMEYMRQGVIVLDDNYRILDVNQMFCTIARVKKSRIIGLSVLDAFPHTKEIWGSMSTMEYPAIFEYESIASGVLRINIAPLYYKEGQSQPSGWVALVDDITEELQAESELRAAHEQLQAKVQTLEQARYAIKTLGHLVPICAECGHRAQLENGEWVEVSRFIELHSASEMTHGICPDCVSELYRSQSDGD